MNILKYIPLLLIINAKAQYKAKSETSSRPQTMQRQPQEVHTQQRETLNNALILTHTHNEVATLDSTQQTSTLHHRLLAIKNKNTPYYEKIIKFLLFLKSNYDKIQNMLACYNNIVSQNVDHALRTIASRLEPPLRAVYIIQILSYIDKLLDKIIPTSGDPRD